MNSNKNYSEIVSELEKSNRDLKAEILGREKTEEAMRRAESHHRAILQALPDVIFRINSAGIFLDIQGNEQESFLPSHQLLGRKVSELLPPEAADQLTSAILNTLASQKLSQTEYKLEQDGTVRHFEARVAPICANEVLVLVRDVSENKRLEQMKTDFIHRAAHELRTPLATIGLMADLIQEGGTPEELKNYWNAMRAEIQRQKNLVEDILTMGRIETGAFTSKLSMLGINETIEEALASVRHLAARKEIKVEFTKTSNLPEISGDRNRLMQVFINLLENAIKFSNRGGLVLIETGLNNSSVEVAITDYGIGIPENEIALLFNRFVRGSNATLKEIPGSGVGLYLVKSLLEKMGAAIDLKSTENHGTKLKVLFPSSDEHTFPLS